MSVRYEKFRDERLDIAGGGAAEFRRDFDEVAGSAAIKHKPTGLFAMGVFSISDSDDSNVFGGFNGQDAPTMRAWNVQAGIQCRLDFLSLNKFGETSLWGGYSDVKNGFALGSSGVSGTALPWRLSQLPQRCCIRHCCQHDPSGKYVPSIPFATQVTGSDVNDWFIALDQNFEAAAFHLYAVYQHFDDPTLSLIDVARTHVPLKLDGFDLGYVGGRIYF
jgi:hypothetical protein